MSLNGNQVVALVPARGGSKGVIGKNMRLVEGVPLVDYTLKAALNSKYIDEVFLSSDDEQTLSYGKKIGVTPIVRPGEFSTDEATANGVLNHFLSSVSTSLTDNDPYIVYLQPTSPLRTAYHIDHALMKMEKLGVSKLISVTKMTKSPFKAFVLDKQGCLQALFNEKMTNERRQDQPQVYLPNGAIYVFRVSDFLKQNAFPSNGSYPYIMEDFDSLDIDTEDDLTVLRDIIAK